KAPEAATRRSGTGFDVVTGFAAVAGDTAALVVTEAGAPVAGGSPAAELVPAEPGTGVAWGAAVDGDVSERFAAEGCDPPEQAVAPRAMISNRTRRFTDVHHRAALRRL
ncbi:MAG TPA: hypothetical protein VEN99_02815, partial [Acidimicrobiia bacterium]|nr:hypothetical protein [Acidimicrobiia bacterium]